MKMWASQMPKGMCLKSEGFASTLYDPASAYTLKTFCEEKNIPYQDLGLPVKLETFVAYGQEFQRRMVPELEDRNVVSVERSGDGFEVEIESGETLWARRVVVAAGISHYRSLPEALTGFPLRYISHSSDHNDTYRFSGKDVTVVGAGASALDLAALLNKVGAKVRLVARAAKVHFHNPPGPRPFLERIKNPMTGLGPGWKSLACVKAPLVFHKMPLAFREKVVQKHLGPAPAWFVRESVEGKIEFDLSTNIEEAKIVGDRVRLHLRGPEGPRVIETDHVIAATGFRTDMKRLKFLSPELQAEIRTANGSPVLKPSFESSVKGLYFVGSTAANSFGPLLRFAYGAGFTARHLSRHLGRVTRRHVAIRTEIPAREAQLS
jgi:thioredoxin reductase